MYAWSDTGLHFVDWHKGFETEEDAIADASKAGIDEIYVAETKEMSLLISRVSEHCVIDDIIEEAHTVVGYISRKERQELHDMLEKTVREWVDKIKLCDRGFDIVKERDVILYGEDE